MALYVTDSAECSIISSKSTAITDVFECVTIDLKLATSKHVVIACVYRAPGSDLVVFCDNIDRLFNQVTLNKTILISGFNINLLKYDSHRGTNNKLHV